MPRDGAIVGLAGLAVSAALVTGGWILFRRLRPRGRARATVMLSFGLAGLALSAGWLLLGAYIDAVTS
jgi:hypothetical protein